MMICAYRLSALSLLISLVLGQAVKADDVQNMGVGSNGAVVNMDSGKQYAPPPKDGSKEFSGPLVFKSDDFTLDKGTATVRQFIESADDIKQRGSSAMRLVSGYAGKVDFHANLASRLRFHMDGFTKWSPSSCMLFFMLYDREGNRLSANTHVPLTNGWHEFTCTWDLKTRKVQIFYDGTSLPVTISNDPKQWAGSDPLVNWEIGDAKAKVDQLKITSQAQYQAREE
jgi:hypothetical protein